MKPKTFDGLMTLERKTFAAHFLMMMMMMMILILMMAMVMQ